MEEELGKEMGERTEKAKEQGIFGGENPRNWQSRTEQRVVLGANEGLPAQKRTEIALKTRNCAD